MQQSPSEKAGLDEKSMSREEREISTTRVAIKLDGTGLPLVPQPNESETDPLNYPNVIKFTPSPNSSDR
jgi:hypothetical protein